MLPSSSELSATAGNMLSLPSGWQLPACLTAGGWQRWQDKFWEEADYLYYYLEKKYFDFLCQIAECINIVFRKQN